ncbi:MAG: response regulator transcription factor [Burkholderiaceae bacterium]
MDAAALHQPAAHRTHGAAAGLAACAATVVAVTVADDAALAGPWCQALAEEGLTVDFSAMPASDTAAAGAVPPQAVVLFCAQRITEQLDTLRRLRQAHGNLPLLAVGRQLRELEQVLALEMGADDVIDAAVSAPVVAARLRALWRRASPGPQAAVDRLVFGRLSLHLRERRVQLGHERIALTECEFEVLWLLALQAGRAVSRADLLDRLRGLPYQRIDRSIDSRVYRIRAKLRDRDGTAQHIRTVRNCGYLFSPANW